jgi:hypothetical protein
MPGPGERSGSATRGRTDGFAVRDHPADRHRAATESGHRDRPGLVLHSATGPALDAAVDPVGM